MPFNLPAPSAKQLVAIDSDIQAVRAAQVLTRTIEASVRLLKPRTVATIAQALRPDLPMLQALAELQIQADQMLFEIIAFDSTASTVIAEEEARIKPVMNRATTRYFELMAGIPALTRHIVDYPRLRSTKVERLIEAGLSPDVAEREAGEFTAAEQIAERDAAQVEYDALKRFIQTKDESLLPSGFAAVE